MCAYSEIEKIVLPNGKTVKQIQGNFYLANPDGSEDLVDFNRKDRSYKIISRVADKGKGRYAYLLNN